MVCGYLPYGQDLEDAYKIYETIIQQKELKFPKFYKNEKGKAIIERLLKKNPIERSFDDFSILKEDSYFQGLNWQQLLEKTMKPPYKPKIKSNKQQTNCPIS